MKLGGEILAHLFSSVTWRAYIGDELMSWAAIEPLIGPNSIDVTLGDTFLIPDCGQRVLPVDPREEQSLDWVECKAPAGDSVILHPGAFMLGSVRERFVCDFPVEVRYGSDAHASRKALFAPMYEGRSSCGRLGLASHITAGFGDYGFGGCFTLELYNHFPYALVLHPGMRIGQVAFDEVHGPKKYQGAYSGANHYWGPVPPKLGPTRF